MKNKSVAYSTGYADTKHAVINWVGSDMWPTAKEYLRHLKTVPCKDKEYKAGVVACCNFYLKQD